MFFPLVRLPLPHLHDHPPSFSLGGAAAKGVSPLIYVNTMRALRRILEIAFTSAQTHTRLQANAAPLGPIVFSHKEHSTILG